MTKTRAITFPGKFFDDDPVELKECIYTRDARLLSNLLHAEHLEHGWLDYCPDSSIALAGNLDANGEQGDATLLVEVYIDKEDFSVRGAVHTFRTGVGRGRRIATVTLRMAS